MSKKLMAMVAALLIVLACGAGQPGGESLEYERAFAAGNYKEALSMARTKVGQGNALNALGYAAYLAGDFDVAEGYLRRAIAADELQYWAHNTLGAILLYQGNAKAAIESFQQSVKANETATDPGAAARVKKAKRNIETAKLYL